MSRVAIPLGSGLLLGGGLVLGRLARATTILGLFDLDAFDPTMLVFWATSLVVLVGIRRGVRGPSSSCSPRGRVDRRLLAGAAIFGAGWGIAGLCPGPAVIGLATLAPRSLLFFAMMAVGMELGARRSRVPARETG